MRKNNDQVFSIRIITSCIFIILAVAGILFSFYLILIANSVYMYVLAILFAILATVSGLFNIFTAVLYYRSYFYDSYIRRIEEGVKQPKTLPTVAVIMPVYNESASVVERNMLRLMELNYDKGKVRYYLGDDSTDKKVLNELRRFCKRNNISHITREGRDGFKAGNVNNVLKHVKEELIAIFDYDEYVTNLNFLVDLVPHFNDRNLAYVQTEKSYSDDGSLFSQSVSLFDAFFFKFIQQARGLNNTAIFAGSCGIVRKSVLDEMNGFPQYIIEDTFFSFASDMHGYKSLYIPRVYAVGKPIKTFTQLVRQQWRYNYGDTQFLCYFYTYKPKKLSPLSHIDYVTHGFGLNYISVILLLFTVVSVLIVFSAAPFTHFTLNQILDARYISTDLEILGGFAFVMSLIVPVILTKVYFNSIKKGIMILLLNFALIIVRTKAAIAALVGIDPKNVWKRQHGFSRQNILFAIANTKTEIALSLVLVALCIVAMLQNNIAGGFWLLWYAALYMLATIFFYKYG